MIERSTSDFATAVDGPDPEPRQTSPGRAAAAVLAAIAVIAVIGVVVAGGYAVFGASADDVALRDALVGRRFVVSSINEGGQPKVLVGPALSGEPAIGLISFGDAFLSASGGCNSTGSAFEVVDGRLALPGDQSTTAAGCGPEVMAQDDWLSSFLNAGPTIVLDGERLTLRTGSTTIELVERAAPPDPPAPTSTVLLPADLTGRTFVATAALVSGVERRIVGPAGEPEPHQLRITFSDGTVLVSAGCNSGNGPYTLKMGRIGGLAISTEMACAPALMDQDAWLNAFFATPPSLGLDGDYLTLGNQIDTIIVFVDEAATAPVAAPAPLFGTRWSLDASASVPSLTASAEAMSFADLTLTEGEPAAVYLRDGCNVLTGDARVEVDPPTEADITTGVVTMGELDGADSTCEPARDPVVEVMVAIQRGTWSYVLDGTRLELTNGDRTAVFRTT